MQLTTGQIVDGRFEVEAMVGEGGLAEVYRVRHRELGRVMALKLLTWRKKSLTERLVLEGRIQAQLDHPNIVAVVDLVRHDGQVGLLMEYVDAESLHDYIQRVGATAEDEALELLAPILAAVDVAHQAGITHRDMKPGNVMLARVGSGIVPKVADFGIAKVVYDVANDIGYQTRAGSAMGTPGYLAPEQVRDASTIDARADVFALGAIAYEVLTGWPAFADDDGHVAVTATATMEPVPVEERVQVSANVARAIREALRKDLDERTSSVAAMAAVLLEGRPDLLASFRSHQAKPVSLSLPPAEATPQPAHRSDETIGFSAPAPTIAPPALPPPTTEVQVPIAAASGFVAAGVMGTLLVVVLVGGLVAYLVLRTPPGEVTASAPVPAPVVAPAPVAPVVPSEPGVAAVAEPAEAEPQPGAEPPEPPSPPVSPDGRPTPPAPAAGSDEAPPPAVPEAPAVGTDEALETPEVPPPASAPPEPTAAPESPPEPPPAPEPGPSYPDLTGTWSGKAGAQRIQLDLSSGAGTVTGSFALYAGTQVRREDIRGRISPDGSLTFTAGDLSFNGSLRGGSLSGTYMRQGAKKSLEWSASPE